MYFGFARHMYFGTGEPAGLVTYGLTGGFPAENRSIIISAGPSLDNR
jgi:hypothetical protein